MEKNNLPDGSIVAFSARLNWQEVACWKHLCVKPLHYVIQAMTGSEFHHVAIMSGGYLWEAMGKTGVRKLSLKERIEETSDVVNLHVFHPAEELTEKQRTELRSDLKSQLGKKFSGIQAMYSAVDRLFFFNLFKTKRKTITMFCSKLVFIAYQKLYKPLLGSIIPRTISPEECKKFLRSKGLIQGSYILDKKQI